MQLTKAMTESDHCADKMELDRALKESAAEFTGAHEDELQRVLKESSMDYVSRVLHRCRVSTSTQLAYHCVDTVYLHFKRTDVRPEKVNGALGLRRNQFRAGTESAGKLVGVVPSKRTWSKAASVASWTATRTTPQSYSNTTRIS